jgi:hypothetical protein
MIQKRTLAAITPVAAFVATLVATLALLGSGCGPTDDKRRQDAIPPAGCDPYTFDCGDGEQCVESSQVCDGVQDCNTGADEEGCGGCEPGKKACDNGLCIPGIFFCDGVMGNCPDGSDEANCP